MTLGQLVSVVAQDAVLANSAHAQATHKNSSYLIEKALCYCSADDRRTLARST